MTSERCFRVESTISGFYCVVWKHNDHYLYARMSGHPNYSYIELVKNGQVYYLETVRNDSAPETIIKLMKEKML